MKYCNNNSVLMEDWDHGKHPSATRYSRDDDVKKKIASSKAKARGAPYLFVCSFLRESMYVESVPVLVSYYSYVLLTTH